MNIGVIGFGHFAGVVAHGLTLKQHTVTAFDYVPPLLRPDQRRSDEEPGWTLNYDIAALHLPPVDLVWIAYDVPLDDAGAPVVDEIRARLRRLDADLPIDIPCLVSCQWPVGTMRSIADEDGAEGREWIYVMENVRAGKAVSDFAADPILAIGASSLPQGLLWKFLRSLATTREPWCGSWESIEFAKHSLNAFLALQIAFVNELARLAPHDVNMADVTRVLKSDPRVSPLAPLTAGPKFGGGSLKRDLLVLEKLNTFAHTPIINAILLSNGE